MSCADTRTEASREEHNCEGIGDYPLEVGEVLTPADGTGQDHARADQSVPAAEGQGGTAPQLAEAAKPRSQVPMWREGLARSALSVDYQRILQAAADRGQLG
ncbi:hypothetical protein ACIQCF_39690 [Streptomyces sp. NPDC088353]|uniref:hypothetical protein n=1 Tax=unclassified Streptomyces TaxID=2593676 RepID=UPI0036CA9F5D